MRRSFWTTPALAAALLCAGPAAAQQQEWTAGDEDRSTIMQFLERDEVGSVAEGMGYDMQDVGHAVLDLNDADAARLAGDVRSVEETLAADVISFTTTTLIIILLVVILLVLVVD